MKIKSGKSDTIKTVILNEQSEEKKLWNGREIESRQTFKVKGTFDSFYKASEWVKDNGYSQGSMARTMPIGLMKGDYDIAKWYNLDKEDIKGLDGVMISNDFREGEVEIIIFKK